MNVSDFPSLLPRSRWRSGACWSCWWTSACSGASRATSGGGSSAGCRWRGWCSPWSWRCCRSWADTTSSGGVGAQLHRGYPPRVPTRTLFFGTIAGDLLTELFNPLYIILLGLVVGMSMAWSFTDDWGEYFALLFWSTVGMMLLTAAEELLTLFLALETMTICLYICAAFEKTRRRSVEGGLKYFVYGSVSSALFLFGLSLLYGLTGTTRFPAIWLALHPFAGAT